MKFKLPPTLVKNSLTSHSWLGLLCGYFMYLICISGSIVVFEPYLLRWEQPAIEEFDELSSAAAGRAYRDLLEQAPDLGGGGLLMLPRENNPRAYLTSSEGSWYLNEDGSQSESVSTPYTNLLVDLHVLLHLPAGIGMFVVSVFGALLCGLIISGFLAHPRIFRDAFNLRLKGSRHLEQADLHNRLSVWGTPFYLMIAITGAWFGLADSMYGVFSSAFFDGTGEEAVIEEIHGPIPELDQEAGILDIGAALEAMRDIAPNARPIYVTLEHIGTPQQDMLLGARHPERLIYVEQYRFAQDGTYLGNVGYTDGEPGQQVIFSTYRLHFGHYGGVLVELLYGIFGLALAIVSVTGVNIWLARKRDQGILNRLWTGLVWGTPLVLVLPGIIAFAAGTTGAGWLWLSLIAITAICGRYKDGAGPKSFLFLATALLLACLAALQLIQHPSTASSPLPVTINLSLIALAIPFLLMGIRAYKKA